MTINHDNWKTAWARGSKFEDIIWIGNDVLAWSSGLHIVFYEIEHKKKSILWCWSHDIGEGVRSLSSHTKYSIFAFAEKSSQPKIMVYTYPSLIKISECSNGSTNHCLCTGFTATDYIVSIDSYPHFRLSVWNWRTGEKIATVQTHIQDEIGQIMRINLIGPVLVAQVGKSCGEAYVWDLIITKETTILKGNSSILFRFELKFHYSRHELIIELKSIRRIDFTCTCFDCLFYNNNKNHGSLYSIQQNLTSLRAIDQVKSIRFHFKSG